jgi:hypothetical protein
MVFVLIKLTGGVISCSWIVCAGILMCVCILTGVTGRRRLQQVVSRSLRERHPRSNHGQNTGAGLATDWPVSSGSSAFTANTLPVGTNATHNMLVPGGLLVTCEGLLQHEVEEVT